MWCLRPHVVTWSAFATLLLACAYALAFDASAVALRVPVEIAAIAVAYLGVCVIAGRIRRAELIARPNGVLSIPQSRLTPAELAAEVARRGEGRLARLVSGWYYPGRLVAALEAEIASAEVGAGGGRAAGSRKSAGAPQNGLRALRFFRKRRVWGNRGA